MIWMLLAPIRRYLDRRRERKAYREWEQARAWQAIELELQQRNRREGPMK